MNPIDWFQDNIFYTDKKKQDINNQMYKNAPPKPKSTGNPGVGIGPFVSPEQKEYINNQMYKNAPKEENPVQPGQPAGEDTVYAGQESTADRIKRREAVGLRNHREGGGNQNRSGITPVDGSFRRAVEAGPDGKVTPGTLPPSINTVWKVEDSTISNGRDDSRVVPGSDGGMVQTGTDMSRSFNDLLATTNTSGYQPFSSNQLPTTGANPYEGTLAKTDAFNPAAPGVTGQSYDNYGAAGGAAAVQPGANSESAAFNPNATRIEGGSDRKKGGSLSNALNDTAGINSYMGKFSSGDQERAANRAFLDTKGSMDGLRAKEAVNGVVYAGGQHYVAGKSGDDKAVAIDRSAARDISNGDETSAGASQKAQDFLAKKAADTVAAIKQAPTVLEQGAKDGAFQQDKPMFSGSTPAIGGAVEFDNNNDKTLPTFGNNGGYKSGFKKIDTSMPNPFG